MADHHSLRTPIRWQDGTRTYEAGYKGSFDAPENVDDYYLKVSGPGMTAPTEYTGLLAKSNIKNPDGSGNLFKTSPVVSGGSVGTNDYKQSTAYSVASGLRQALTDPNNPTIFGKIFSTPLTATVGGAGLLAGIGLLGSHLGKKFGLLAPDTDPLWYGLGGAAVGGAAGYFSNKYNLFNQAPTEGFTKSSSMWQDPRNFLLEKLQRSQDINAIDKALLANKIRNMDHYSATNLEKLVRGALGIGVGTIIAKFFGLGALGTALSAMGGIYAMNTMGVGSSIFK